MIPRAVALSTVLSLTCAHALAAQTLPDMVPREFVEMLSISPFMDDADIAVGRLPDRLDRDLTPGPDTRIIGSLISSRFSVSGLVVRGSPAAVQESLVARLTAQGWTALPTPPESGGFETRESEQEVAPLCSPDDHNVQITVSPHRGDSAAVRLFLGSDGVGVSCNDPELASFRRSSDYVIPALHAPLGAQHMGGGTGGSAGDVSAHARIRVDLQPAELIEHYAAQMADAGWQAGAQSASPEAALMSFQMTDDSRVHWRGVLYVIVLPGAERDLYLRVTRER